MTAHPQRTIYLADDDEDDCMLFEDALNEVWGNFSLVTANDGAELMDILDETVPPTPYVIFLDLNMPRKNGFECLKEIRATQKLKDIPVVIFSTSNQEEAVNRVYHQGANVYIQKPGSYPKLKNAILRVLETEWLQPGVKIAPEHFKLQY